MKEIEKILRNFFPNNINKIIIECLKKNKNSKDKIEEIRVRINKPIILKLTSDDIVTDYKVRKSDLEKIIALISENSVYSYQNELSRGFITVAGGHRVGLVGKTNIRDNHVRTIKDISSINFRISREVIGASQSLACKIYNNHQKSIYNTLIVGSPGCGKTTLLRDLTRIYSEGSSEIRPHNISLVDERSEIAGTVKGVPQKEVGLRTDVLDGCPKAKGITMVLRSMSPDLIVTDEIGSQEDVKAVGEALNAGVKLLLSAHSDSYNSLMNRPGFSELLDSGGIERVVFLTNNRGPGTVESIVKNNHEKNKKQLKINNLKNEKFLRKQGG
ncbi:stage III sporulation protein AA [Natranaerobius trueperi]|uniref:Stage III sporulation protein AA n=1 Tax=Natranaerobius trueperi TaxID=759412 RepID=A0A226BYM3_9FIRM|nr:stage III sporulation protein AA [Natranaerobius trueperi]OWZ84031.1 stage III sporulation protein AA [Natranaerobius trueperi]